MRVVFPVYGMYFVGVFYEDEHVRADADGAADEACSADDPVDGDTPTAADGASGKDRAGIERQSCS